MRQWRWNLERFDCAAAPPVNRLVVVPAHGDVAVLAPGGLVCGVLVCVVVVVVKMARVLVDTGTGIRTAF